MFPSPNIGNGTDVPAREAVANAKSPPNAEQKQIKGESNDELDPPSDGDESDEEGKDATLEFIEAEMPMTEDPSSNWDEMVTLVSIAGLSEVENPYSRNFIGMKIMIKWDFGWQIGTILKRAHRLDRTRGKNFEIVYGEGDRKSHNLVQTAEDGTLLYTGEPNAPIGAWLLLE